MVKQFEFSAIDKEEKSLIMVKDEAIDRVEKFFNVNLNLPQSILSQVRNTKQNSL